MSRCKDHKDSAAVGWPSSTIFRNRIAVAVFILCLVSTGPFAATRTHNEYLLGLRSVTFEQGANDRGMAATHNSTDSLLLEEHPPHPHAGARFANGSWGYVADVTAVRKWMTQRYKRRLSAGTIRENGDVISFVPFRSNNEKRDVCNMPKKMGPEKKAGWRLLSGKVEVHKDKTWLNDTISRPKVLCAVYTHAKKSAQITAIAETWGWRCDGFFAASTITVDDPSKPGFGSVDLPHLGTEKYTNMWQKTRSIWAYVHDHYLNEYDYFFLSGDDTHAIVENLRLALDELGIVEDAPLYLGHFIPLQGANKKYHNNTYFCGGGPGYVLNREALRRLVRILPSCFSNVEVSAEDRFLGYCLSQVGISGNHSVDSAKAQRFHGMDANFVASYRGKHGYYSRVYQFWGDMYGYKTEFDIVATNSVSFHLVKSPIHMKRHHAILYRSSCPRGSVLGNLFAVPTSSQSKL